MDIHDKLRSKSIAVVRMEHSESSVQTVNVLCDTIDENWADKQKEPIRLTASLAVGLILGCIIGFTMAIPV